MEITNLINKLKCKIKKIELIKKDEPSFLTTKIIIPSNLDKNKKYIALQFNDECDDNNNNIENKSFILLKKKYHIISYHITIKLDYYEKHQKDHNKEYFLFTLGIKENSKIKTIKSSKTFCLTSSAIDNQLTISNTIIYASKENQELCLIAQFPNLFKNIDSEKCILQILSF